MKMSKIERTEFTHPSSAKQVLGLIAKIVSLLLLFVFLSGHEKENPVLGETRVEFFCAEFRQGVILFDDLYCTESGVEASVSNFYQKRNYFPAWTINFRTNKQYQELYNIIASAREYGLFPEAYNYSLLQQQANTLLNATTDSARVRARVAIEQTATRSALLLMEHLSMGIRRKDTTCVYRGYQETLPAMLSDFVDDNSLGESVLKLQPENRMYKRLQQALARYVRKSLSDTATVSPTILAQDTLRIKSRLAGLGYTSNSMDIALRAFQKSHALDTTGVLDTKTLDQLALGFNYRFYRLALNMDRLRKSDLRQERSVIVNIPEYKLRYHNAKGDETEFKVMVGKPRTPTPELSSAINQVVANPYWTVTRNIARYELLPRIKKDPDFLRRNGFSVLNNDFEEVAIESIDWANMQAGEFDYWLRQNNRNNALGVVKFLFPNDYRVYLHDTQSKRLFSQKRRAYSHGCIRVQNPEQLAQLLLDEDAETSMDIQQLIRSGRHEEIQMNVPVHVAIRYFTCTADSVGMLQFHPDVYAKDTEAIKNLFGDSNWN